MYVIKYKANKGIVVVVVVVTFLSSGFVSSFDSTSVKKLSNTNFIGSSHVLKGKSSLPVDRPRRPRGR